MRSCASHPPAGLAAASGRSVGQWPRQDYRAGLRKSKHGSSVAPVISGACVRSGALIDRLRDGRLTAASGDGLLRRAATLEEWLASGPTIAWRFITFRPR